MAVTNLQLLPSPNIRALVVLRRTYTLLHLYHFFLLLLRGNPSLSLSPYRSVSSVMGMLCTLSQWIATLLRSATYISIQHTKWKNNSGNLYAKPMEEKKTKLRFLFVDRTICVLKVEILAWCNRESMMVLRIHTHYKHEAEISADGNRLNVEEWETNKLKTKSPPTTPQNDWHSSTLCCNRLKCVFRAFPGKTTKRQTNTTIWTNRL